MQSAGHNEEMTSTFVTFLFLTIITRRVVIFCNLLSPAGQLLWYFGKL